MAAIGMEAGAGVHSYGVMQKAPRNLSAGGDDGATSAVTVASLSSFLCLHTKYDEV